MSQGVPVLFELDIKKRKLEQEIQQLEKQLHKQTKHSSNERDKNIQKRPHLPKYTEQDKETHQEPDRPSLKKTHTPTQGSTPTKNKDRKDEKKKQQKQFKQKEIKPAISDNWKQLFQLQPQLSKIQCLSYFPKDEYRTKITQTHESGLVLNLIKKEIQTSLV